MLRPAILFWDTTATGWDATGSWSTLANNNGAAYDPSAVPGASDTAVFSISTISSGANTVNLNANQSVAGLIFGNNSPVGSNTATYTLQGGGTDRTLTIGSKGITMLHPVGAVTIGSATSGQKVTIQLDGNQTWNNNSTNLLTVNSDITNASSATPVTLTLSGGNGNNGSGATTIKGIISDNGSGTTALTVATRGGTSVGGVITLSGINTYTGATTIQAGQLMLDFSAASALSNIVSSSSSLVMGGGALFSRTTAFAAPAESYSPFLNIKGKNAATNSQTFNGTTLKAGQSNIILTQNSATSVTLNLGTITRTDHATLNVSNSTGAATTASGVIVETSNSNDSTGILGTWATVGGGSTNATGGNLDYAKVDGNGYIVANGTSATTANSTFGNMTDATVNYTYGATGTITLAGSQTGNTLRFAGTGAASIIALGTNTLTLNGLLYANSSNHTLSITSSGSGGLMIGSSKELVIISSDYTGGNNSANIIISAAIKDYNDGSQSYQSDLVVSEIVPYGLDNRKSGVTLSGANTYTGTTYINYGYVSTGAVGSENVGVSGNLGNGGNITFSGGTLGLQNRADYSSRFKNSTSAVSLWVEGAVVTYNSSIDSSNTGGLVITSIVSGFGQLTLNAANAYLGDTILGGQPYNIILGNKLAFSTGTVYSALTGYIAANTDLSGTNKIMNTIVNQSSTYFKGENNIELGGNVYLAAVGNANSVITNDIVDGKSLTLSGNIYLSADSASSNQVSFLGRGVTNITGAIANNDADNTIGSTAFFAGAGGVFNLSGQNTNTGGYTIAQNAMVNLDYASSSVTSNIVPTANGFTMRGGILKITGKDNTANSQVNSMTIEQGASKLILAPGVGGSITWGSTGTGLTRSVGGLLDISTTGVGTTTILTSASNTNGILRGITYNGNDWATKDGSNNVVALTSYTTKNDVSTWSASGNENITTTGALTNALTANTSINTLRFNADVATGVDAGGFTLTSQAGILVTSSVSGKALTISNGYLQGYASGDLIIINRGTNGTTLTVSAVVQNNGANATALTKAGTGTVVLTGANTYTGATYIDEGVLKVTEGVTNIYNQVTNAGTSNSTSLVMKNNTANTAAAVALGATSITVADGSQAAVGSLVYSGTTLIGTVSAINGNVLTISAASAAVANNVTLSFTIPSTAVGSTIYGVGITPGTTITVVAGGSSTTTLTLSVAASAGNGSNIGIGSNTTTASLPAASNIYLRGGVLGISGGSSTNYFTRSLGTGPGQITFQGNGGFAAYDQDLVVNLGGNTTPTSLTWGNTSNFLGAGATFILSASDADHMVDIKNPINLGSLDRVIQVDNGSATYDAKLSGILSGNGGLTKTGAGTLWLGAANTYTGETTVLEGTLALNGTGSINSGSSIRVDGATAVLDLGTAAQNSSGTSAVNGVKVDNGGRITGTTATITAQFFDVRSGSIDIGITNTLTNGSNTYLTKSTSGTFILNGANTYQGATIINEGTLFVNGSLYASGQVLVNSSGKLGGTGSMGNVTLSSGATVVPGTDGSIGTITATSLIWNGGAAYGADLGTGNAADEIMITGAFTKGTAGTYLFNFTDLGVTDGSVYTLAHFGSTTFSAADFTYSGLAGYTGIFTIVGSDLRFTVTAIPEPSTWALLILGGLALMATVKFRKRISGNA